MIPPSRVAAVLLLALALIACVPRGVRQPPARVAARVPDARTVGIVPVPTPSVSRGAAARALVAFRASCPALLRRADSSWLTINADWSPSCQRAVLAPDAATFFAQEFATVRVGSGAAFATGYYEPEIAGARASLPGYLPVYRRPDDLVVREQAVPCPVEPCGARPASKTVRGRLSGDGGFMPYFDRSEIDDGALSGRGLEIAWAADPVELFFLQVQGSGRLRLPDGSVVRIGYAEQNGWPYTGIGALMAARGLLGPGERSMQGIMAWLRAHPDEGRAIMRENRSYVFFRELAEPGPVGAVGVAVTARVTVAADPAFVPLGAPVILDVDRAEACGLWIAQDTGGAIKGPNRFDTFWGAGDEARRIAGGMSARGTALILLPKVAVERLMRNGRTPPVR